MYEKDLEEKITELISLGREGDYWDFKKLPHSNPSDLLHDIICLANSLSRNSKHIIIGVSDPEEGCVVEGLFPDTEHRKKQHHYNDFLRDKKFAGDIRPSITLHTLEIENKEIDVLVIDDTCFKPYYLIQDTDGIKAFHIYTRFGDTNTPKNSSADLYYAEKLWQQRFGLDLPPIDRFEMLLGQENMWNIDVGNREYSHHKHSPEYQIRFCKTHEGREPYSHYFPNPKSFFGKLQLMYFSTVLYETGYCGLDEFRIPNVTPHIENLEIEGTDWFYYYFEMDSIEWKINKLLGLFWMSYLNPDYWPFVVFHDSIERERFNQYLIDTGNDFLKLSPDEHDLRIAKQIDEDGEGGDVGPEYIGKTVRAFREWRSIDDIWK
ncbi:MAG: ATP-binding protein [Spirochaetia bacterium]|nr:ATP-binding protein [Spirochaetia bacterium]